ncbi:MAG: hypothetical protein ABWX96_13550 [Propionibacteriaceae bacterium]
MPIAKQDLSDGFTMVAREGTYVSNEVVERHGWQDKVEPGEDPTPSEAPTGPQPGNEGGLTVTTENPPATNKARRSK